MRILLHYAWKQRLCFVCGTNICEHQKPTKKWSNLKKKWKKRNIATIKGRKKNKVISRKVPRFMAHHTQIKPHRRAQTVHINVYKHAAVRSDRKTPEKANKHTEEEKYQHENKPKWENYCKNKGTSICTTCFNHCLCDYKNYYQRFTLLYEHFPNNSLAISLQPFFISFFFLLSKYKMSGIHKIHCGQQLMFNILWQ